MVETNNVPYFIYFRNSMLLPVQESYHSCYICRRMGFKGLSSPMFTFKCTEKHLGNEQFALIFMVALTFENVSLF